MHVMKMPKLGLSSESSLIGQWMKNTGDYVEQGEIIVTVETDKSVFEVESEAAGYVLALLYNEGDEVKVLEPIVVLGEQGEVYEKETEPPVIEEAVTTVEHLIEESHKSQSRTFISPRARFAAQKRNIPLEQLEGTGPNNRIVETDVLRFDKQPATEVQKNEGFKEMSHLRKLIAKNMMQSLQQSAQLTLHTSFDATAVLQLRERFKAQQNETLQQISMNDIILFAVSRVLKKHPAVNAHIDGTTIKEFEQVHVGVALDLPRGLIVPTLFGADQLSLARISVTMKEIYAKCKDNAILPEELQGATFTVTNLGALGIESFTPIINPPQVAILGVCTIVYKVRLVDGEQQVYPSIPLSLTFDHRALDGAPAARFLKDVVDSLENIAVFMAL